MQPAGARKEQSRDARLRTGRRGLSLAESYLLIGIVAPLTVRLATEPVVVVTPVSVDLKVTLPLFCCGPVESPPQLTTGTTANESYPEIGVQADSVRMRFDGVPKRETETIGGRRHIHRGAIDKGG